MRSPYATVSRRRLFVLTNLLVLASLLLTQIGFPHSSAYAEERTSIPESMMTSAAQQPDAAGTPVETTSGGLTIKLREGNETPSGPVTNTVAPTEPLTPEETQALLDRLPPLVEAASDQQEFRLPAQSLPPPRPETVIEQSFPPTETVAMTAETQAGDLEVLRFAPEGEIRMAPFLQVTFNQPMVPLGTLEQLAAEDVPVTLTPQLPGLWKWLGTRTLTFEYKGESGDPAVDRFPMATEYSVEVPEGTTSAVGGVLQKSVRWSFTTPPPTLRYTYPGPGPQRLDPLFFVSFDQLIDPQAVLNTVTVMANGEPVSVRLAAGEEVAVDPTVTDLTKQAGEGRWLAFRAEEELPYNATINVNIGPNTPSAEGPLVTDAVQAFSFQTYGPLRVTSSSCAWGGNLCQPGSPFQIEFTNPLDLKSFDPALISVSPVITGMNVQAYGNMVSIQGATAGRTTYEVTVSGEIQDVFGQSLGDDQSFSFTTDRAYPMLTGPYQGLVTADPSSKPVFTVYAMNYPRLHVRLYTVQPDDWPAWQAYQRDYWQDPAPTPPGELVYEETIATGAEGDELTEVNIDLQPALGDRTTGHIIAIVDVPRTLFGEADRNVVQSWVQVTQLALDAFSDSDDLVVWATRLADGAPIPNLPITFEGQDQEGVTGEDGTLTFSLNAANGTLLVGRQGDDSVILPRYVWDYYGESGWSKQSPYDELRWYIFDDRQMYRPKEEVHVKGWVRRFGQGPEGDIGLVGESATSVQYQVMDPVGNLIHEGSADLNALDGFDLVFTLPVNVNLGYANIYFTANGVANVADATAYHSFQIQEFRRPEFSVTAQTEGEGPWYLGDSAIASVKAAYYAGGALPSADTTWNVSASPASYAPPNWPDFTFGIWQPWWAYRGGVDVYSDMMYTDMPVAQSDVFATTSYQNKTDATGTSYLKMDFVKADEPRPYTVNAEASVMDVNRQTWSSSTSLLMHPSELYIGMSSPATFVEAGQPMTVAVIVTDVDGNAVAERNATVKAARQEWAYERGNWTQKDVDVQTCEIVSGNEPESCSFDTSIGGEYRIWAEVRDDRERLNRSQLTRWVSGGAAHPTRNVEMESVDLIPDKETYADGDVAEILVQSPFGPAQGLLTVARNGILYTERFEITESTITLKVPIKEAYVPNLVVKVDLTGSAPRLDDKGEPVADVPPRPAYASSEISLSVPPLKRTITLAIAPDATEVEPGAKTAVEIVATNAAGEPVAGAELAVVVVDEAVLALTGYELSDPLLTFYREVGSGVESVYSRANVILLDPASLAAAMMGGRGGGGGPTLEAPAAAAAPAPAAESAMNLMDAAAMPMATAMPGEAKRALQPEAAIAVRSDFNPLAVFAPAEPTDAEGRARVEFTMPDNLTRYRVMVVAATEQDFGSADANITARLPLMVRPSAPRFLNFGDHFEFPVVIQNQTNETASVSVAMTTSNLTLDDPLGQRVTVPANDRVEVRFPASPDNAGTARFQVAAAAGDYADAANGTLPVYTPATTEAFAVYGVVDEGAVAQPLTPPQNVFPQFGGLEVNTSSTALSALTDAVIYLYRYPFECSEQMASRILSIASLRDVLTAFNAAGLPSPAALNASMEVDVKRLSALQNLDGGFPVWEKGEESIPYNSIYVTQALQEARLKDYAVPDETLQAALTYLRNIESYYPSWYSEITRRTLSAYALYVRDLMGDTDAAKARAEINAKPLDEQSLEAIAWLWQVLADDPASTAEVEAIRQHINNSAVETAGAANFYTSYGDQDWVLLHSNRRTDGIVLDALINDEPESDLIPKVVNGLLAAQSNGRWNNTQENTFILLALDRYFNTFENIEPDFVARAWLGDTFIAEHTYQGYTTDMNQTVVPMQYLVDQEGVQDITLAKEGDGRMYYRLGLSYAPTDLQLDPLDMGFVVARTYEAIDDPLDVQRDADGTWRIKAGARVRVRLQMVADSRRYHVALVDPLPAGLEPVNPALATSQSIPGDLEARPYGWWWYSTWYEHQNLRDSQAEAFTSLLWDGVYDYNYVAQATTPGEYVVPPAKAEEMYSPEVFGRSGSDRVIVE